MPPCADPRPVGPGSARGARAPRRGLPHRGLGPRGLRVVLPCAACLEQEPAARLARPSRAPLPEDGLARLRTGGLPAWRASRARRADPRRACVGAGSASACDAWLAFGLVWSWDAAALLVAACARFCALPLTPVRPWRPDAAVCYGASARAGLPTGLCATLPLLWWSREAE